MISQTEVIPFLLKSHRIQPASIIASDLKVMDISRRNQNFKVISKQTPSFLLKQGKHKNGTLTVSNEAKCYEWFHAEAAGKAFRPYLPNFHTYDTESHVLLLEYIPGMRDLRTHIGRVGRFSQEIAKKVGKALGTLHTCPPGKTMPLHNARAPWILDVLYPRISDLRTLSSANLEAIKMIQRYPDFCDALDSLREEWEPHHLIHFDFKWDNILISTQEPDHRKRMLKIVDWELAQLGDPAWDVGTVFMDYLAFWLYSIPITGDIPPENFPQLAKQPIEKMQPALNAFWQGYVRTRGLNTDEAHHLLLKSIKFAAVRLVQTAYEVMQMNSKLTAPLLCLLQVSQNILKWPNEAIPQLLGISNSP